MKISESLWCLVLTISISACHKKDNDDGYTGGVNWQTMLGGTDLDGANDAKKTSDGGLIVTGYTKSADGDLTGNKGGEDILVGKLDASGKKQWVKNFGGSLADNGSPLLMGVICCWHALPAQMELQTAIMAAVISCSLNSMHRAISNGLNCWAAH